MDPSDIFVRIGSLSPFGKENSEIVEQFDSTFKKYEKFLQAKENIELDPYRVSYFLDKTTILFINPGATFSLQIDILGQCKARE